MGQIAAKTHNSDADGVSNAIEERLQLIIDTIPTIVWRKLPDGSADFLNRNFREYTGLSLEDGLGWGWMNAFHPDDRLMEEWRAALAAGKPFEKEARLRRADGQYRWFLIRAVPLRDEPGNIVNWYGTSIDIEDLKRDEDRARLVINTIPTMVWTLQPDGAVDFVNQRWLDYTGLTLEEEIEDPTGPVHPEDLPRVMEKWLVDLAAGEPSEDEMRLRRADGEYRWFLVRTVPLRDEQGNIVKWYGTSTDIEDRKRAEDALRESEEKFRQLAENIGEVFWMTTPAMDEVLYVSPAYESVWGRSLESVRQRPQSFMDAIHSEDRERVVGILEGQRQQGFEVEYRIVRPDGSVRWIRDRGFPVKDASGKVYRIAGVAEDITERKWVEMALQKNEQLLSETQVLGRTGSWEHNLVTGEIANTEGNLRLFFGDDHSKGARFEDFAEVVHQDDREYVNAQHAQLLAEGGP